MMNKHYWDLDSKDFKISKFDYSWAQKPCLDKLLPNRSGNDRSLSRSTNDLYRKFMKESRFVEMIGKEDKKQKEGVRGGS